MKVSFWLLPPRTFIGPTQPQTLPVCDPDVGTRTRPSGLATLLAQTPLLLVLLAAAPVVFTGLTALAGPAIPDQTSAILADLLFAIALFVRHLILSYRSRWIERSPQWEELN